MAKTKQGKKKGPNFVETKKGRSSPKIQAFFLGGIDGEDQKRKKKKKDESVAKTTKKIFARR